MPFMRTSSLDLLVNSIAFHVHHYVNNLTIRQRTPYLLNRALTTLYRETSLPSVRTRGQIDALTFFKCIRLTSQLTYESIVHFEIEMWIIFLPGSSSLITLNLALTIYIDWRFLLMRSFGPKKKFAACILRRSFVVLYFCHQSRELH